MLSWQVKHRQPLHLKAAVIFLFPEAFGMGTEALWGCRSHVAFAQLPPTSVFTLSMPCAGSQEDWQILVRPGLVLSGTLRQG